MKAQEKHVEVPAEAPRNDLESLRQAQRDLWRRPLVGAEA